MTTSKHGRRKLNRKWVEYCKVFSYKKITFPTDDWLYLTVMYRKSMNGMKQKMNAMSERLHLNRKQL